MINSKSELSEYIHCARLPFSTTLESFKMYRDYINESNNSLIYSFRNSYSLHNNKHDDYQNVDYSNKNEQAIDCEIEI